MERFILRARFLLALSMLVAIVTLPQTGCVVGLIANVMYQGHMIPAPCEDLEGKKVAVICVADSGDFGPNPHASLVANRVSQLLAMNVKKITVIDQQKVEAWQDEHDSDVVDYAEVGKGVGAELVVAIEIEGISLQDNQTLYKGRAEYALKVVDVSTGKEVYNPGFVAPVEYPRISGLSTVSVSKREFTNKFIDVLSNQIGHHFFAHDRNLEVAIDTPDLQSY